MSADQTSTAKRHTRVSTCWLLNPNRLATHVVAHRLVTVAVSKWLWVLSEVLNFNDDRWCAHVCLCVAARSRLELLSPCLYSAQRNQRCPLSNHLAFLLSSKGSIFAEFTLQTVCSYGCSDPVPLKWDERRYWWETKCNSTQLPISSLGCKCVCLSKCLWKCVCTCVRVRERD